MRSFVLVVVTFVLSLTLISPSLSQARNVSIDQLFASALQAKGERYFDIRAEIVSRGKSAIPLLKKRSKDRDWHKAAVATAIAGRIEKPDLYRQLEDRVQSAVDWACRCEPGPGRTIIGLALGPIHNNNFGTTAQQSHEREPVQALWKSPDATAFMLEAMLKGHDRPNKKSGRFLWGNDWGRNFCTAKLGISPQPVALTALLEALSSPDLQDIASAAAAAFRAVDRQKAERPLLRLLRAMKRPRQDYVVQALANLKSSYAAPYLVGLVDNANSYEITMKLLDIGGIAASQALLKIFQKSQGYIRQDAADALARVKAPIAIGPLIRTLKDGSDDDRWTVAQALGAFQNIQVTNVLLNALQDPFWLVRSAAAESLGRSSFGDERVVRSLIQAATDKCEDVRESAITALSQTSDPAAADVIMAGLTDIKSVRMSAIRAEEKVKDPRSIELLIGLLDHGEYEEKLPASLALSAITGVYRDDAIGWHEWWTQNKDKFNCLGNPFSKHSDTKPNSPEKF